MVGYEVLRRVCNSLEVKVNALAGLFKRKAVGLRRNVARSAGAPYGP